jgi:hydrogenase/urease accessory protein HupE
VNVYEGGSLRVQEVLDGTRAGFTYDRVIERIDRVQIFTRFLREGVHHIFIGPDHILFIVGLILTGGGLRRLLKVVTAFTVAHSMTLALAVSGVVHPSAGIVEPAIAASVIVVGAENLLSRSGRRDLRPVLAFVFGLIHGFGFASVLQDLGLPRSGLAVSLVAFNAGVEVGQAAIVLTLAPVLHALSRRSTRVGRGVVVAGSLVVMAAGGYWLVVRTFLG